MKPPLFVRPLVREDKEQLKAGLRTRDAFTLRRCQILLRSADGLRPSAIAAALGCSSQSVRDALRAFAADGLACLRQKSTRPKTIHAAWPKERDADLRALLHQSPRNFGKTTSLWTLELAAQVCFEQGWTVRVLSGEAIRLTLKRLGMNWKKCKLWMSSPDPNYAAKKARRDQLIALAAENRDWVLGFEDEVWWSRLARPSLRTWTDGDPEKMHILTADEDDPDPDAIACYGFLRADTRNVMVRFVEDRPLAELTIQFLDWTCWKIAKEGKKRLVVIWDDASWHTADAVCHWVEEHNQRAKRTGGIDLVICDLPVASPWLNNIEPCWIHAKRAILEPDRKLTAEETVTRVCQHFKCDLLPYMKTACNEEPDAARHLSPARE